MNDIGLDVLSLHRPKPSGMEADPSLLTMEGLYLARYLSIARSRSTQKQTLIT